MYVITGATGNTGKVAVEKLLAAGAKVRVIGRSAERLKQFVDKGAEAFLSAPDDAAALTRAFTGAKAVYALIPADMTAEDFRAHQERVSDALAAAVEKSGVTHVVALSSIGADKAAGVGPVVGLHNLEQKFNRIPNLNVLCLRPGFFMENLLAQIGVIQKMGVMGGIFKPNLPLPQIATRDIGAAAAERLLRLDFSGHQTRELLGPRDVSMAGAATIIGKAIGKPGLSYMQAPAFMVEQGMLQLGLSASAVKMLIELSNAANSGDVAAREPRSPQNSTSTTLETFVAEEFVPRFQAKSASA